MAGRECYHCKQWVEEGEEHDCWTTTEAALTQECVFLGRALKAPHVRRVDRVSKSKVVHVIQIKHRDEVEPPITDWLQEAYELSDVLASGFTRPRNADRSRAKSKPKPRLKKKKAKAARKIAAARKSRRRPSSA